MFMRRLLLAYALTAPLPWSKGAPRLHHYHAFGLRIGSEIELPELHPGTGPADVVIRFARFEGAMAEPAEPWVELSGEDVVLRFEGIRFAVRGGREIAIRAPAATAERDVRIWLLGTVAAALLHQRGYLPVHANVVKLPDGGAAAFAGHSGAGKSTLAAWMDAHGHEVLTDDLCAIRIDGGAASVFEGVPRMKLWPDSLHAFGRSSEGLEKVSWDLDKYHVPIARTQRHGALGPVRLERVYLLAKAAAGEPFAIQPLAGNEAALGILANAFRWNLGQLIHGEQRTQFDQCVELARHASVFEVRRSWNLDRLHVEAQAIERHLLAPLEESEA